MGDSLDDLLGFDGPEGPRVPAAGEVGPRLSEERSHAEATDGFVSLSVDAIRPNEHQPRKRFDDEDLAGLVLSISSLGVLQPVLVRHIDRDRYELIAGERRWRAARRAGLTVIPAIVRKISDQRSLEEAVVENLHRADLSAIEEAAAYRQLIDEFALTQEAVAERVGKSRSAIANTLRLLSLADEVQRMVLEKRLSAGHARALLGVEDREAQCQLAERTLAEGLNVRQVERLVRAHGRTAVERDAGSFSRSRVSDASVLEFEQLLEARLSTGVEVKFQPGKRGRIVVEFADLDDLARINLALGLENEQ